LSIKRKEIQKKRNIKSRKIDKRKRKMLVLICIIIIRDKEINILMTIFKRYRSYTKTRNRRRSLTEKEWKMKK